MIGLPQTAADQSPPICGHPESVSVSTYSDFNPKLRAKNKITSVLRSGFRLRPRLLSRESSGVMTLDSRGRDNSEYATTSCGARELRAEMLGTGLCWTSQSSQSRRPRPPPSLSTPRPGWKSVCNPFVTRNISFLTGVAPLQTF